MYLENFTASTVCNKLKIYSKIKHYDSLRAIAYLDEPIDLVDQNQYFTYDNPEVPPLCAQTPPFLFGSNTFTIRNQLPILTRSYVGKYIGINNNSILEVKINQKGEGYKINELIGSYNTNNECYYDEFYGSVIPFIDAAIPNYILVASGYAFVGRITSVDENGGILEIETLQQGYGYKNGYYNTKIFNPKECNIDEVNCAQGKSAIIHVPATYQTIEIAKRKDCDLDFQINKGNFLFLPLLGQNSTSKFKSPTMPRFYYTPIINPAGTTTIPYESCFRLLDIKRSGYPPLIISCASDPPVFPETGTRMIIDTGYKDCTFNTFWKNNDPDLNNFPPIVVLFLKEPYVITDLGVTDTGEPVFIPHDYQFLPFEKASCDFSYGILNSQIIEILPIKDDSFYPLNYTGTTVSQNQVICYEITLISLILPNIPLKNTIGGIIAFYPYIYVEFSNVIDPNSGNKNILYSNNPNAKRALFKVSIQDTNNPERTSFVKLKGDGTQTIKFKPNDYLFFRVFLSDGVLFETALEDHSPPLPPNFFVQISAEFEIKRLE